MCECASAKLVTDCAMPGPPGELEWESTARSRLGLGRLGRLACESLRSLRASAWPLPGDAAAQVKAAAEAWAEGPKRIFSELTGVS